jgi:alkylated DNA nucleotide flippase Atl1
MSPLKEQIFAIVNRIPKWYISSYGMIAKILAVEYGRNISAQMVGWTLSGMSRDEWNLCCRWRVVNKDGFISSSKLGEKGLVQAQLLEREGNDIENGFVRDAEWWECKMQ